jgi:hypothetical protein
MKKNFFTIFGAKPEVDEVLKRREKIWDGSKNFYTHLGKLTWPVFDSKIFFSVLHVQRERERERGRDNMRVYVCVCVCVWVRDNVWLCEFFRLRIYLSFSLSPFSVCTWEREWCEWVLMWVRDINREIDWISYWVMCVCVCLCECVYVCVMRIFVYDRDRKSMSKCVCVCVRERERNEEHVSVFVRIWMSAHIQD